MFNNGSEAHLLNIWGVLPIYYIPCNGQQFNIPIQIWLPPKFPYEAPLAFVKPVENMQINPRCKFVDPNGQIWTDYLKVWEAPNSTLLDAVADMQIMFGQCTPVCLKEQNNASPPSPRTRPNYEPPVNAGPGGSSQSTDVTNPLRKPVFDAQPPSPLEKAWPGGSKPQPTSSQTTLPPPSTAHYPPPAPTAMNIVPAAGNIPTASPLSSHHAQYAKSLQIKKQQRDASYRIALTRVLSMRLSAAIEYRIAAEREEQVAIKRELEARAGRLAAEIASLHRERNEIDSAALELSEVSTRLRTWLQENEPRAIAAQEAAQGEIDPDTAIVSADELSEHALLAQSADLALEDSMVVLEQAFSDGIVTSLDDYLKCIREAGRQQFIARAVSRKVAAQQAKEQTMEKRSERRHAYSSGASSGHGRGVDRPDPDVMTYPIISPSSDWNGRENTESAGAAQLPIGDQSHVAGGILLNPLIQAAQKMSMQ